METLLIIMAVIAFLIIFGIIVVFSTLLDRKRTEALHAMAGERNLAFFKDDELGLLTALNHLSLFSKGRDKKVSNVIKGDTEDIDIFVFDYEYTTGQGKSRSTPRQTVMMFRTAALRLPAFALRPENVFHKIGGLFGYQDIDFEHFPDFSAKYLLRGEDEEAVRNLFTESVLFSYEQNLGWCTEGDADTLVFYRDAKRVSPDQISSFMEEGIALFALYTK